MRHYLLLMSTIFLTISAVAGSVAADDAPEKSRVLMLTESRGFEHGPVKRKEGELAVAEVAMTQLGQKTGLFEVDCTQNSEADFTKENLQRYDIVMFYTQSSGALPIADEDRDYFINEWMKQKGHGYIGFHSASDTFRTNDPKLNEEFRWYWDFVGGTFNGHPWNSKTTVTITVHDPDHPTMKPFGKQLVIKDEIYQYRNWQPEKVRVLMSLDMTQCEPKRPYHVPVAWVKEWGDGKLYYNNLGHNAETWTNPAFLESVVAAVEWIQGSVEADATPNPELSAEEEAKAKAAAPDYVEPPKKEQSNANKKANRKRASAKKKKTDSPK